MTDKNQQKPAEIIPQQQPMPFLHPMLMLINQPLNSTCPFNRFMLDQAMQSQQMPLQHFPANSYAATHQPTAPVHYQFFDPQSGQPVIMAKIGNWTGRILFDTGSGRTVMSTKFAQQVGGYKMRCIDEHAFGLSGSINLPFVQYTSIEICGYKLHNHPVYFTSESQAFEDEQQKCNAIIGTDIMSLLPPAVIDWQNGSISILPRLSSNVSAHHSSRAILNGADSFFDSSPSILQQTAEVQSKQHESGYTQQIFKSYLLWNEHLYFLKRWKLSSIENL